MRTYGLIGYPLSHSFSKKFFTQKFQKENIKDCIYKKISLKNISELKDIIDANPSMLGFNVTIPHKESIIPYLDEMDETALQIGAVNVVRIKRNNFSFSLKGYNTDAGGFEKSIQPFLRPHHKKALILGTGGASKAVAYVLKKSGIEFCFVSREKKEKHFTYSELNNSIIEEFSIIINTTPVGMYPDIDNAPAIPYKFITSSHFLYDLIYNPEETLFLKKGREKEAVTINGLAMLQLQADKAWEIWKE